MDLHGLLLSHQLSFSLRAGLSALAVPLNQLGELDYPKTIKLSSTVCGGVRNQRFEKARQELVAARSDVSVTEVAARWGFGHLGRFAVEYRFRFGESPSQTLGKRNLAL